MIGPVMKTDAAVGRAGTQVFQMLPVKVRLALLALGLLVGMIGCSAAWIDQQSYVPSPQICRADEVHRTDCVPARRAPSQPMPTPAGWDQ